MVNAPLLKRHKLEMKDNDFITINNITIIFLKYKDGKKYKIKIISHNQKKILIQDNFIVFKDKKNIIYSEWCLAKDDVSPQQIFDFHKKDDPEGNRAKIAKYWSDGL